MAEKKLTEEEQQAAIDKVLGEPIFDGFSENVYRIRRNLLGFAVLSLVVTLNDLTINETNLPVRGLSNQGLYLSLFLITIYHYAHFMVYVRQYWAQWRIRLTGNATLSYTTAKFGQGVIDYNQTASLNRDETTIPHQSTLYSWWKKHKNDPAMKDSMLRDGYVTERLKRFDDAFWKFQRQQHLNWIVFEVSAPILAATAALALLLFRFCGY